MEPFVKTGLVDSRRNTTIKTGLKFVIGAGLDSTEVGDSRGEYLGKCSDASGDQIIAKVENVNYEAV